jgi:hypothetical protein
MENPQTAFVTIVPALFICAILAFAPLIIADGDPYWHIAAGRWMIQHLTVPHVDPFSYTFAGAPWNAHEWLSEVIMGAVYRWAGWSGIYLLFGLAIGLTSFAIARALLRFMDPVPAFGFLNLALIAIVVDVQARPQFLALPVLALWTGRLLAARDTNKAPSPTALAALMVLWANLHGSFILGLVLFAVFAAEAIAKGVARKQWLILSAVILVAAMMTPEGFPGLLFPIKLMNLKSLALINEWKPLQLSFAPFEVWLLATLGFALICDVRMPLVTGILFLGAVYETFLHKRYVDILLVIGTMILAEPFGRSLSKRRATPTRQPLPLAASLIALGILLAVGVARVALPKPEAADYLAFVNAASHVSPDLRARPVLNAWGFGGYMIFDGERPFIDGRADMYGDEFVDSYAKAEGGDRETLKALLARYAVAWTIFPPGSPANKSLDALGWPVLYRDASAVIHIRETIPPR